ncbi:hypothetical protein JCM11641_007363 [Rhodosporidiobolus odoratus]
MDHALNDASTSHLAHFAHYSSSSSSQPHNEWSASQAIAQFSSAATLLDMGDHPYGHAGVHSSLEMRNNEKQAGTVKAEEGDEETDDPPAAAKGRGKKRTSTSGQEPADKLEGSGQAKKKRKQLVACDSCRLRRVKCNKAEMADGEPCGECAKKNIFCTDTYVKSKPKVARGGKLITAAKLLYGDGASQQASMPSGLPGPLVAPDASPGDGISVSELIRDSSGSENQTLARLPDRREERLMSSQVQRDIAEQLIRTYFSMLHPQCPLVDQAMFMQAFDAAGRVAENMSPANECLALAIQAWASRFSDNMLIVGPGSPTLSDLRNPCGYDFTMVGNRREQFAIAMRQRALEAVDRHGIWRLSSAASCSCLSLLEFLFDWDDPYRTSKVARYASTLAAEHLRQLQLRQCDDPGEQPVPPERLSNGTLLWMVYTRDAISSMMGGRSFSLSEDDLTLLCDLFTNPIAADPEPYITSTDARMLSGLAVAAVFRYCVTIIRNTITRFTGPLAWRQRVEEQVIHELWAEIDQTTRYAGIFRRSVDNASFGPEAPKTDVWFRDLTGVKSQHILGIHLSLVKRLEEEEAAVREQGDKDGGAYLALLRSLKAQSDVRMLSVAREYTQLLRGYGSDLMYSAAFTVENGGHYLSAMLDAPAWEQGGDETWTWAEKVAETSALINALKLIGWAWAGYDSLVRAAQSALAQQGAQLQRAKATHHAPPTASYDLVSQTYPSSHAYPTSRHASQAWAQPSYPLPAHNAPSYADQFAHQPPPIQSSHSAMVPPAASYGYSAPEPVTRVPSVTAYDPYSSSSGPLPPITQPSSGGQHAESHLYAHQHHPSATSHLPQQYYPSPALSHSPASLHPTVQPAVPSNAGSYSINGSGYSM